MHNIPKAYVFIICCQKIPPLWCAVLPSGEIAIECSSRVQLDILSHVHRMHAKYNITHRVIAVRIMKN